MSLGLGLGLHSRATFYIVGVNVQRVILRLVKCYIRDTVVAFLDGTDMGSDILFHT